MKLIILYGPPASGKLTIAKAIAKKNNFKLFHNHLTVDLLKNILDFGTPEFFELNQKIKLDIIEAASKQNIPGMVYTFVYDKNSDQPFIERLKEIAKDNNITLKFFQIYCHEEELKRRVVNESRKEYKKVRTSEGLTNYLQKGDFFSVIDSLNSITINNTNLTVDEAVYEVTSNIS